MAGGSFPGGRGVLVLATSYWAVYYTPGKYNKAVYSIQQEYDTVVLHTTVLLQ